MRTGLRPLRRTGPVGGLRVGGGIGPAGLALVLALAVVPGVAPLAAQVDTPPDPVRVDVRETYYELPDTTLTGVVSRLNATRLEGPGARPSQGLTRYSIQPRWQPRGSAGRCRITGLTLDVRITITLPEWPAVASRPANERRSWETIEASIRTHEYRHRDLTVEAARALAERLRAMDAPGCRALDRAYAGEVALTEARLREAHEAFDRETPVRLPIGG